MSAVLLGLIAVLCLFSDPVARAIAELITRIELAWIGGELPWTP